MQALLAKVLGHWRQQVIIKLKILGSKRLLILMEIQILALVRGLVIRLLIQILVLV